MHDAVSFIHFHMLDQSILDLCCFLNLKPQTSTIIPQALHSLLNVGLVTNNLNDTPHQAMHTCHFTFMWHLYRHPPWLTMLVWLGHRPMEHNRVHLPVHKPYQLYPNRSTFNSTLCFSSSGTPKLVSTLANLTHAYLQQMGAFHFSTLSVLPVDILTNNHFDDTMSPIFNNLHLQSGCILCLQLAQPFLLHLLTGSPIK